MEFVVENLKPITSSPEHIAKFKEFILESVLQGKLDTQNDGDEPAIALLNRLRMEMDRMVKEGMFKKNKPLPLIDNIEEPYKLPPRWCWTRLGEIIKITSGKYLPSKQMNEDGGIPVYGGNGVTGYHDDFLVSERTIVIGRVGFYCGSVHLTEERAWVTDNAFITYYAKEHLDRDFLVWLLKGTNLKEDESATAQPVISGRKVYPIVVGLPPIEEQRRIVQKVNHLFRQIDALAAGAEQAEGVRRRLRAALLHRLEQAPGRVAAGRAWAQLEEQFGLAIRRVADVQALRQSILQLAVKGLLVEQNPKDEPALVLLERIKEEKARLVEEGKIRKQKALPAISEEEKPFEAPEGWVWCRLGELIIDISSGWSPKCHPFSAEDGEWGVLKVSAVSWGVFKPEENKKLPIDLSPKPEIEVKKGDYLMSRANTEELIAKSVIVQENIEKLMMSDKILRVTFSKEVYKEFIQIVNNGAIGRKFFAEKATGTSKSMKNVSRSIIKNMPIPLPPLAEQRRIVERVEGLLAWCGRLEEAMGEKEEKEGRLVRASMNS